MRAVKWLLYVLSIPLGVAVLVLLIAFNMDLGRFKPQVETLVSGLLQREFRIDGPLQLTLDVQEGLELQVADVHLAATDWSAQPDLVSVGSLALQLDLWSVFESGPIVIDELTTDGIRVHLEKNADGVANWEFFPDSDEPETDTQSERFELPVLPERVLLRDSVLSYDTPQRNNPLRLELSKIAEIVAHDRHARLTVDGSFREVAIELALDSERLDNLVDLRDVDLALSGKLGEVDFTGSFAVADLLRPGRPTASLNLTGPSSEYLLNLLELEQLTSGPLDLRFKLAPGQQHMQLLLDGHFGELTTQANGHFDDLSLLQKFAIEVTAQGPDLGNIAEVLGIADVLHAPFSLNGKVERDAAGLALSGVALRVDQSSLLLDAQLPGFPGPDGAHATARLHITDVAHFSTLSGLPGELAGPLDIDLDVAPLNGAEGAVLAVKATNSGLTLKANGNVIDAEDLVGTVLQFDLSGPGLGPVTEALALKQGPQIPFELKGGLRREKEGFSLDKTRFLMADHHLSVQGMIGNKPLEHGTNLAVELRGDNLSMLYASIGMGPNEALQEPYHLSVTLKSHEGGIEVPEWRTTIGTRQEYQVVASALLASTSNPVGSELKLKVHGPSLATLLSLAEIEGMPAADFEFAADIEGVKSGYRLNSLSGRIANERLTVDGTVGEELFSRVTRLRFQSATPALKRALASYGVNLARLPEGEFKASGRVTGNGRSATLEQIVVNYVGMRGTLAGDLGEFPSLSGTALKLAVEGQNLGWLLPPDTRFSGLFEPFSMSADLGIKEKNITIGKGQFGINQTRVSLDGELSLEPMLGYGSFTLGLDSPNLAPLLEQEGVASVLEALPVQLKFTGHWKDDLWTVEELDLRSGNGRLMGSGTLVGPPNLSDSNLKLNGHFANLANFNPLFPVALPALPAKIDVHLLGDGQDLRLDTLDLSVGESKLAGELTFSDGDIPRIVGKLHSELLDVRALLPASEEDTGEAPEPVPVKEKGLAARIDAAAKEKERKLIPDTPIPMEALQGFYADVDFKVDELYLNTQPKPLTNLGIELLVEEGGLEVRHLSLEGAREGKLEALGSLKPSPGGPVLKGRLAGTGVTMGLPAATEQELERLPSFDVKLALSTRGETVKSMAAALNGYLRVEMGRGRLKAGATRIFTNDFIDQLMDALNPFSKEDPYTKVRCGMVLASVESGQITGKPVLIFRTDRINITADTKIDLDSEKLEATFNTTPRKGLGFSLSSLVNPYVMVIGTLANPVLSLDPEGVLVQGGVAVATGGLSIIAKGLKDRFFSEKDPCGKAMLEADKDQQALEEKYRDDPILD